MEERRTEHRSSRIATGVALSQNYVRMGWLGQLNDATQVLFGAIGTKEPGTIYRALLTFERQCPVPRTTAERVVLRGTLVETFLRLETSLNDWTSSTERAVARKQLHDAGLPVALDRLLAPARNIVAAAQRMRTLPPHERVRKWIDEHPEDSRSIRELATLLGTHPRTLNRHFGCHIGKTVQEYRWERRAERAEQLLATSALKLEDVASAIGARSKATVYRLLHKRARSARK